MSPRTASLPERWEIRVQALAQRRPPRRSALQDWWSNEANPDPSSIDGDREAEAASAAAEPPQDRAQREDQHALHLARRSTYPAGPHRAAQPRMDLGGRPPRAGGLRLNTYAYFVRGAKHAALCRTSME